MEQQHVSELDFMQIFKLGLKYALEGLAVGLAMYLIAGRRSTLSEIVIVGLTAALTFLFLDIFAPTMGDSARVGSGFGLGYQTASGFVGSALPLIATSNNVIIPNNVSLAEGFYDGVATVEEPASEPILSSLNLPGTCGAGAGSPFKVGCGDTTSHYNRNCNCDYSTCTSCCKVGQKCNVTCKDNGCIGCYKPDDIRDNNCAYKIIPGQYSARVVLPGYNECVKPYNQVDIIE
jgi:hypothetical protein